jgi:hypothetical protein
MLFVDYVRMLRNHHGGRSLSTYLEPEDLGYLQTRIEPEDWYPMASFERLGLAILKVVAEDDLAHVRQWGYMSAARVARTVEGLLVVGDPRESLMRLQVFRRGFFDFDALSLESVTDTSADVRIDYGMSPRAEEAASVQTAGFLEGLVDMAGGRRKAAAPFSRGRWLGDPETRLSLTWQVGTEPSGPSPSATPAAARTALPDAHVKG